MKHQILFKGEFSEICEIGQGCSNNSANNFEHVSESNILFKFIINAQIRMMM